MSTQSMNILDRVMGDRGSFSLEERIFHFYSLFACLFCLLAIISDRLLGLSWTIDVVVIALGLIFALTYWFSRVGYDRSGWIRTGQCILLVSLLPFLWLLNGGVVGSASLCCLALVQYFTVVLRPAWLGLVVHFVVVTCCFSLECFYSNWITPYDSLFSQKMDMFFALSLLGVFVFGNYYFLLDENKIEREQLILKNQELEDYRQKLENTNRLLAKAQEIAKVGFFEVDLNDSKTTWSEETFRIFNRNPSLEPLTFAEFKEKIHPEDWQTFQPLLDRAIKEGIPYENEKRIILNDRVKTLFSKVEAIKDKDNKVIKLFGVIQDITDQKRLEDELRHNKSILEIAQRIAKVGYWEFEPENDRIEWSEQTFYIMGFDLSSKAPSLSEIEQRIHPDDREFHKKALTEAVGYGIPYKLTLRLLLPDRSIRYIETTSEIERQNNKVVKIYGSVLDITDRKLAEVALKNSEEKYKLILEHQTEYVMQSKPDTRITFVNQAMCRSFNSNPDKIIGLRWRDFVPADELEVLNSKISALSLENPTFVNTNRDFRSDGTIGWTEWVNLGIFDPDGKLIEIQSVGRDVTDRKLAELALIESEARLQSFLDNSSAIIYIKDLEGKYQWVNRVFEQVLQISKAEIIGLTDFDILPLAEAQTIRQNDHEALCHGAPIHREEEVVLSDGLSHSYYVTKFPLFDSDGKTYALAGISIDITDRKITENDLRDREALLDAFFSQCLDGCFFTMLDRPIEWNSQTDKEKEIEYAMDHLHLTRINRAFADQYKAKEEELLGLTPRDFFANNTDCAKQLWHQLFDLGTLNIQIAMNKFDGTPMIIEGDYVCLYDDQGRIIGHFGIQRDITDRIKMENELRESEERFRNLANNIPGVILRYVLHPDGTDGLHYISPGCFDLWGVSQEEALADVKKLWDRCLPEDIPSMYQSMLSSAQGQTIWECDWRICTTTGQIKWVSGTGIPSKQDNGDVIWDTIITDITDRRRSQSELENLVEQRTKDLQASQQVLEEQLKREQHLLSVIQTELKQKDTLLKEVHHRVKNNLQIISSLMRLQVDNHQDQQLKAFFQDSQNRIQSMALIHERLYRSDDLSQIDTQIYFKELTDYLCQTYNTNSQKIEVILDTPPILLEIDKAIPCGLIVNELFTNSLKYAFQNNDGGTITLTSQQLDQTYNLQIKDTGNGLSPDFDLSRSRSLGLRLVDRLVKQLRGSITMQYDKGMVFLIEFPL